MNPFDNSRELLAAIVESSDDAIITQNLDGIITSWNPAAEKIFGYSPQEAIGQPVQMLIPSDHLDEEPMILQRIRRGERIRHYETLRKAKNGAVLNISLSVSPIFDSEGRIIGASKIARDITPEIRGSESLRHSEEQFRVTLGSIGDAVIATDRVGKITFMNRVAEQLTGWSSGQALGVPLEKAFKIVNEFTRVPCESPVKKVLQAGEVVGLANHTVLIAKDGTERPIDDSGAPIRAGTPELLGVVLVFRDVAERRAAEINALRLAAIIQGSDDAIIGKNLDGIVTSWNDSAERIFGYSADEMTGQSIKKIIPPDLIAEEDKILARLRRGERVEHFETVRVAKDGRKISVSLSISPMKDREGRIIGASKIARDITERRRAEEELAEARARLQTYAGELEKKVAERTHELEATVGELEAFSYSLTHDMRAPLRSIQSFCEIVLEQHEAKIGEQGGKHLKKAIASAQRMDKLILDMLSFTRLSRATFNIETVDVEKLISGVIQERNEFQADKADIQVDGPLPKVAGNEACLTQCITNLLENAVKFVKKGAKPHIHIYAEENDWVRLWFEDNGIGIDEESRQRLFQMFQRVHSTAYPGTGIGLALVRKAVRRMGGEVGVESEPGKGSRFWLQLPREPA